MEIVYNAAHPDRLLMLGASSYNWISTDFGKTFSKVRPRSLSSCPVVLHPRVYSVCRPGAARPQLLEQVKRAFQDERLL